MIIADSGARRTGLRGTLKSITGPTVEPDPDNAGGGNLILPPFIGAAFLFMELLWI